MYYYLIICVGSFLLGSIPFGVIISKKRGVDIKRHGSGNIGATNVARALGLRWAAITLFFDSLKGFLPPFLVHSFFPLDNDITLYLASLSCILGHQFSIFEGFKGGKGVATSFGVFLYIAPVSAIFSLIIFIFFLLIFRIVSIGSLLAALSLPIWIYIFSNDRLQILFAGLISLLIWIAHRDNLKRFIAGKELKF